MPITYNINIDIDRMIAELPEGLCANILAILSAHTGREHALPRWLLRHAIDPRYAGAGNSTTIDRRIRLAINQLRKAGYPICSTGGVNGGYFMARDQKELEEYIEIELHSRAIDLLTQETALRAGASRTWGPQLKLL